MSRSCVNVGGNPVQGINLGSGGCVFKTKTGSTLLFKTISVTGASLSISSNENNVIISGSSIGGGIDTVNNIGVGDGCVYSSISSGDTLNLRTIIGSGDTSVSTSGDTIIVYSSGGSGTTYNFTDGLTEAGGNVSLGGTFSNTIVISGSPTISGMEICTGTLNLFGGQGISMESPLLLGQFDTLSICASGKTIGISESIFNITDDTCLKGMTYNADYSANGSIDPRWIPDAGWVTGQTGGGSGITTVNNIGVGDGCVYSSISGGGSTLNLRSIVGSGDTSVSTSGDTVIVYSVGGTGTTSPGGVNGSIQYNDNNNFNGSNFCYDDALDRFGFYSGMSATTIISICEPSDLNYDVAYDFIRTFTTDGYSSFALINSSDDINAGGTTMEVGKIRGSLNNVGTRFPLVIEDDFGVKISNGDLCHYQTSGQNSKCFTGVVSNSQISASGYTELFKCGSIDDRINLISNYIYYFDSIFYTGANIFKIEGGIVNQSGTVSFIGTPQCTDLNPGQMCVTVHADDVNDALVFCGCNLSGAPICMRGSVEMRYTSV